jgi:RNase H-like domain found in reverse transcriptase
MASCGHWTPARIDEAFAAANAPLSTLKHAEENFNNKHPSMLATDHHKVQIQDMILTHLKNPTDLFSKPFDIYTDAFAKQIGAVIQQHNHPLAFYSHKVTDAQTR